MSTEVASASSAPPKSETPMRSVNMATGGIIGAAESTGLYSATEKPTSSSANLNKTGSKRQPVTTKGAQEEGNRSPLRHRIRPPLAKERSQATDYNINESDYSIFSIDPSTLKTPAKRVDHDDDGPEIIDEGNDSIYNMYAAKGKFTSQEFKRPEPMSSQEARNEPYYDYDAAPKFSQHYSSHAVPSGALGQSSFGVPPSQGQIQDVEWQRVPPSQGQIQDVEWQRVLPSQSQIRDVEWQRVPPSQSQIRYVEWQRVPPSQSRMQNVKASKSNHDKSAAKGNRTQFSSSQAVPSIAPIQSSVQDIEWQRVPPSRRHQPKSATKALVAPRSATVPPRSSAAVRSSTVPPRSSTIGASTVAPNERKSLGALNTVDMKADQHMRSGRKHVLICLAVFLLLAGGIIGAAVYFTLDENSK